MITLFRYQKFQVFHHRAVLARTRPLTVVVLPFHLRFSPQPLKVEDMDTHVEHASRPSNAAPRLSGVLETSLYVDDLGQAEHFYGHKLGLEKIFSVPGRQLVFRSHDSILLIFRPDQTERERVVINGGAIPFHGARGPGHMAFQAAKSDLEAWRAHFLNNNVPIESEVSWPNGAHSIYFRDPSGNSLELASPDMWANLQGSV